MAFVIQTRKTGPYRRTLKSDPAVRYVFEPGEALDVPDEHVAELLELSPGALQVVVAEERGGEFRRWRHVDYTPPPRRDSQQNPSAPQPVEEPAPRRSKRKARPSE